MKKLLTLVLVSSGSLAYAMQTVNLTNQVITCSGQRITAQSTDSMLLKNCKGAKLRNASVVVGSPDNRAAGGGGNAITSPDQEDTDDENLERVKFYADNGNYMKCYFKNNKLFKCKAKVISSKKIKSTASNN